MKGVKFLCLIFLMSILNVRQTDTYVTAVLSTVKEVFSFGMDLYSFFDSLLGESEESIDYDRIINSISERIEMSTEIIVNKIELQSYISEVREVALIIKQLLSDVKNILNAPNEVIRKEYQIRFQNNFSNQRAVIYKVKSLLTFKGNFGGSTSSLLTLIVDKYDCSIPLLWEFKNYYMTLVSDVVAFDLLNERLSSGNLYNETLSSWRQEIAQLLDDFKAQENACIEISLTQAKTDFKNQGNAKDLYEINHKKYPHLITDVLRLGGSYCALVLKGYEKVFQKSSGNTMTFEFISSGENIVSYSQEQLERVAATVDFNNCKGSADMIQLYFHVSKHDMVLWVMYPTSHTKYSDILLDNSKCFTFFTKLTSHLLLARYRFLILLIKLFYEQSGAGGKY